MRCNRFLLGVTGFFSWTAASKKKNHWPNKYYIMAIGRKHVDATVNLARYYEEIEKDDLNRIEKATQ